MRFSEKMEAIAAAIVKAQKLVVNAKKSSTNPHLKSTYANLGDVLDAVDGALETCDLAVIQTPTESDDSKLHLETMILHTSGQWMSETMVMPLPKQDPQGYGAALTYARRYHLCAMLKITQEDDDGQGAKASVSHSAKMIESAKTMEELQTIFKDEYRKFDAGSPEQKILIDAKDSQKVKLSAPFDPKALNIAKPEQKKAEEKQAEPEQKSDVTEF
jgi:hypothetical protein